MTRPSPSEIARVFSRLEPHHPQTMLEQLQEYTHFQQLVATLLSSRTKDTTTIPIVKRLFTKYHTPRDFLNTRTELLAHDLYGIGFYRVKARNIQKLSKIILEEYNGKIPSTVDQLTALPGVGRKTANCMLNYAFQQPAIAVDVHVHRIANRLGWIQTKTPEETETALQKIIPQPLWIKVNMLLVGHGQTICFPRNPNCAHCPILQWCAYGQRQKAYK